MLPCSDEPFINKMVTHSIRWAKRRPEEPRPVQGEPQGAPERGGYEIPDEHECFSSRRLFHLSSAQCLSFSVSESQRNRCCETQDFFYSLKGLAQNVSTATCLTFSWLCTTECAAEADWRELGSFLMALAVLNLLTFGLIN